MLRSYEVWVHPDSNHTTNVVAESAGKAKLQFRDYLDMDIDYIYFRCRVMPGFVTDESFLETANYRDVPFARIGMRVEVGDRKGMIVGKNSSANFNVIFDGKDGPLNCHPNWNIKYFDDNGALIREFPGHQ